MLLWWGARPEYLQSAAHAAIAASENEVYVSAASVWELGIKAAVGRLPAVPDFGTAFEADKLLKLDITFAHARAAAALPLHHRDPFDRMLVAQAQSEGLVIVSRDRQLAAYDVPIIWG